MVRAGVDGLGAAEIRELASRVCDAFAAHRDEIDALNVFPVPDGDTGTNLFLTARSALEEAGDRPTPDGLARGALLGARGNSGVIFSQVMRAVAEALEDRERLDAKGLAEALRAGTRHAYEAVANPVEGTMLSAIRAASDVADRVARRGATLAETATAVCEAVQEAVARTPAQLEVLRKAGVVDAGARGFQVFCEALAGVVAGAEASEPTAPPPVVSRTSAVGTRESGSLEHRFEVQYLLTADPDDAPALRRRLEEIGDSVVVVGAGDVLNVHVHTNDVGAAIEEGIALGRPWRIQVTSFADQMDHSEHGPASSDVEVGQSEDAPAPLVGCVAVMPGPGLRRVAEALGATVVDGAAGSLPAVADLLAAFDATRGNPVLVLPGHPNAVPTAQQAAGIRAAEDGRRAEVVAAAASPTKVLAALAVWDAGAEAEEAVTSMETAAEGVASGEVVEAVRDAQTPVGEVRKGAYLGVDDRDVVAVSDGPLEALVAVAEALGGADAEIVTLVVGADVGPGESAQALEALSQVASCEIEVLDGGQRPARYLLGVER
jgi:uncharacterized protein